jgi:hypothetical protein
MKQCQTCKHYHALKSGEPPAGWCEFILNSSVPFWMEQNRIPIESKKADVVATDGCDCAAHTVC